MLRLVPRLLVVLTLSGCGGALPEVEAIGEPTLHRGRVVAARGPTMARVGDLCSVEVMRADGSHLNCRIRVRCHDDLVYGLSGAGYNHCRSEDGQLVFAQDSTGTRRDGDPRLYFDLHTGRVIISDDDPDVEVLVDLLTQPPGYAVPER